MLDQLVESKNHLNENRRRSGFLLTAFTLVCSVLTFALLYSLFSYNLAMANDKLDISSLATPVNPTESAPPVPEQVNEPRERLTDKTVDTLPVRKDNFQNMNEQPIKPPDGISTDKNKSLARPQSAFKIGTIDSDGPFPGDRPTGRSGNNEGSPLVLKPAAESPKAIDDAPPPVIKKAETKPVPVPTTIKKTNLLNGQAIKLITPSYPASAKAIRAAGAVNVQVTIDENGNVITASAVNGHPLLRQVSEQAARASKFSPTFLNGQRVKVTGVILYNFVVQ